MSALCRGILLAFLSVALIACEEDGQQTPSEIEEALDPLSDQRRSCEDGGGSWVPREGGILFACLQPTRDANQSCQSGSDCDGACLARSRTCAPVKPLFGCHEILSDAGQQFTECLN